MIDRLRNTQQKTLLLSEAARLGHNRSSRAQAKSRELCDQAQTRRSKNSRQTA